MAYVRCVGVSAASKLAVIELCIGFERKMGYGSVAGLRVARHLHVRVHGFMKQCHTLLLPSFGGSGVASSGSVCRLECCQTGSIFWFIQVSNYAHTTAQLSMRCSLFTAHVHTVYVHVHVEGVLYECILCVGT